MALSSYTGGSALPRYGVSSVLCGGEADLPPNVPSAVPKVPSPAVVLGSRLTPTHPQGPSQWAHVSGTLAPPAGEGKPLLTCRGHRGSRGGHGRSSAPQQLPLGSSQVHFPKAGVPRGVTAVAPGPFHQTGVHPQKLLTLLSSVMGRKDPSYGARLGWPGGAGEAGPLVLLRIHPPSLHQLSVSKT